MRYAMRLAGIPLTLEAILTGSWYAGWRNRRIHLLGKIMGSSMIFYYPLEHLAFGKWMAPNHIKRHIKIDAEKYSALSCLCWLAYIVCDFYSSILKVSELEENKSKLNEIEVNRFNASKPKENEGEMVKVKNHGYVSHVDNKILFLEKAIQRCKLQLLRCVLQFFPAIEWSLPIWTKKQWLKNDLVNSIMSSEALVNFVQSSI